MSKLPPDESPIASAGADSGRRKAGPTEHGLAELRCACLRAYVVRAHLHAIRLGEFYRDIDIHAERHPLLSAGRFGDSGHDIDVYAFGSGVAPLVAEVKARKNGAGLAALERWLREYGMLALPRDHEDPLILFPCC